MAEYDATYMAETYESMTAQAIIEARLITPLMGGQPADEAGVRAFCEHHLHLAGDDLDQAVKRILEEEVGEAELTPEGGEIAEKESYGVTVLRRDPDGCAWVGDWQIKAGLKCAGTRLGLFTTKGKQGSKGDLAEMGRISAHGLSNGHVASHIRLYNVDGTPYIAHEYERIMGRVHTAQGAKSIVRDFELAPAGTRLCFEFRWPPKKLKEDDIVNMFAAWQQIGIGSGRSLERGKLQVDKLTVTMNT